jgi:hypothetical protein
MSAHGPENSSSQDVYLCKYCGHPAWGHQGIAEHLEAVAGDELHPSDPEARLAAIKPPQNQSYLERLGVSSSFDEDADNPVAEFRRAYESAQIDDAHRFVTIAELEELYDEFLQHQDSSGWISASKRLREFIDERR